MYEASKIIMWLRQLLTELGFPPTIPTIFNEDNKSAVHFFHGNDKGRTKHMDVRCHLIRDLVENNITMVKHKPTEDMIADILTKPLDPIPFHNLQPHLSGHLV